MSAECIFCKIVSKEIPTEIIYEDEYVLAFPDISPVAPKHILLIPKKHIAALTEISAQDKGIAGHFMATIPHIAKIAGIDKEGFRAVMNNGKDGGQTVGHLHCHIMGGRYMQWPPG